MNKEENLGRSESQNLCEQLIEPSHSQSVTTHTKQSKLKVNSVMNFSRCHWALFSVFRYCFMRRHICSMDLFCSLCNCMRYVCVGIGMHECQCHYYRFFVLIEFKVKRTATLKWNKEMRRVGQRGEMKKKQLAPSLHNNSVHLRFFSLSSVFLHIFSSTHTCAFKCT